MPLRVNEFVIQAKFEDDPIEASDDQGSSENELLAIKDEIIAECMEKIESYLQKMEGR
jgi:hypothetical protein